METAPRHHFWIGAVVVAVPSVYVLGLSLNYALLPWACGAERPLAMHLVTLAALVLIVAGGGLAWRARRRARAAGFLEAEPGAHFLLSLAVLVSGLFAVAVLAEWLPQLVLNPCLW